MLLPFNFSFLSISHVAIFFQSPDIFKAYVEEFENGRIPYKDSPELIWLLLEFSSMSPSLFEQCKVN